MDYFSKWPEAEAIKDKSANSVAIVLNKVICIYTIHCTLTIKRFIVLYCALNSNRSDLIIILMHQYFVLIFNLDLGHQRS